MRMLYTNPRRDAVVPSYIEAHWLNKRERMTIVAWRRIVVFRLHRIHPSRHCIGSLDWLQLHSISPAVTLLDARFDWKTPFYTVVSRESKVQIGLNNSNTTWALALIGFEWISSMVEKKIPCTCQSIRTGWSCFDCSVQHVCSPFFLTLHLARLQRLVGVMNVDSNTSLRPLYIYIFLQDKL